MPEGKTKAIDYVMEAATGPHFSGLRIDALLSPTSSPRPSSATADSAAHNQPFVIGVSGGTASGKTTVCDMIIQQLHDHRVVLVNQDSFYRGLTPEQLERIHEYNFDHPDAFDTEQLLECVEKLKCGHPVQVPIYDFKTHQRCSDSFRQYAKFVKPAFNDFVLPSKKYADVIIPRGGDNHLAIDLIVQHIHTKLGQHDLCKIYPNVNVIQSTFQIRGMHTLIRDRDISKHDFVFYSDRLIRLVVEHGLGHLPFTEKQIVTPTGSVYTGVDFCKKLCGVSIVRSGESMENALRACCKGIKIGKILIHRDGDNGKQLIYEKLPNDISERRVLLLDPVLATVFLVLLFHVFNFSSSLENLTLSCKENEKKALLKFKENISNPSGKLSSWNEGDCCKWSGVSCSTNTGHVIKLNLQNTFSSIFEVNPSLLQLNYLSYLDLSMNNFGGAQIPEFFGSFTRLRYLNLSGSSFGGKIPRNLGNLSGLQYLDLRNYCNDPVENGLKWLSGLSSLKYLNLEGVDLHKTSSHWLQTINTFLPSLSELHLSQCQLMNIPLSLPFVNFTSLSVLDLSNNGFKSTIPNWLFNLTNLKTLYLNANNLHGVLPDEFSELNFLENLDLSSNFGIEGPLPKGLGVLCNLQKLSLKENRLSGGVNEVIDGLSQCRKRSLENLNLGYNELNGHIPSSLGLLKNLKYLLLSNNAFTGPIPSSIGNLTSLEQIFLSSNEMNGTIPESFGQLKSLVVMDLYQNSWEGVITEVHLANLSSLQEISIGKFSTNLSLVFNVSSNWIPPLKLKYVKIQGCKLGPKFPAFLMRNQSDLETVVINLARISDVIPDWFLEMDLQMGELDLASNQLSGRVPSMIKFKYPSNLDLSSNNFEGPLPLWSSNLTKLYLNDNKFSGMIPENIGTSLPYLRDLDISRNNLNGTIPLSMGNLTELTTLAISSNQLHGKIPDFWAKMQMLYILDMSNNDLSGAIPGSIGFLSSLKFLVLSNNSFSGKLPSSLRNCTELASLDLGDNNLSGKIPPWIGLRMTSLLILRLRNNSFTGKMPSQICNLSVLHILDIARNSLSGKIPACFGDLDGFKRNTSDDTTQYQGQLEIVAKGTALLYYSTLYLVNSIDLSGNNFSGEIPSEITILVRLQTLILSMNHLTGKIPPNIERLKWIETLDLSKNRLSGPIPPGMASLTFLNHLNLSYNNLSGQIPTGNQFLTLNDPSIYEGNALLCGFPLSAECNRGTEIAPFPDENVAETDGDDRYEKLLLSVFVGLGFFVGFWGVCGSLIVKKQWRDAFFSFCERVMERILDIFSSNAWLRRKFRGIVS
ncbi:hypothetical protein BUALT_Bualt16G0003400 [Buddleja alternifolia]|uniref:uridine/cytidine kinase n=1 Tax=Buddleja alternifolia TaxID=168488 RepID=A0AAV6WFL1_9LAMI|nr:hypothetical protein BUALT_Bualt16G0003400 [Buddleja alternifolia]